MASSSALLQQTQQRKCPACKKAPASSAHLCPNCVTRAYCSPACRDSPASKKHHRKECPKLAFAAFNTLQADEESPRCTALFKAGRFEEAERENTRVLRVGEIGLLHHEGELVWVSHSLAVNDNRPAALSRINCQPQPSSLNSQFRFLTGGDDIRQERGPPADESRPGEPRLLRFEESLARLLRALDVLARFDGRYGQHIDRRNLTGMQPPIYKGLGVTYSEMGRPADAEKALRKVIAGFQARSRTYGRQEAPEGFWQETGDGLTAATDSLCIVLRDQGKRAEARKLIDETVWPAFVRQLLLPSATDAEVAAFDVAAAMTVAVDDEASVSALDKWVEYEDEVDRCDDEGGSGVPRRYRRDPAAASKRQALVGVKVRAVCVSVSIDQSSASVSVVPVVGVM